MIFLLSPPLQFEAAWILNHICCEAPVRIPELISAKALPVFMLALLASFDNKAVCDQIIWILGI